MYKDMHCQAGDSLTVSLSTLIDAKDCKHLWKSRRWQYGGKGNDSLASSTGNATLSGGGNDTGPNTLVLDGGIGFDALSATRQGDDLVLAQRGVSGSTRLAGYFQDGTAWTVVAADGQTTDTDTLVAATTARASDVVASLRANFEADLHNGFSQTMASSGFAALADGIRCGDNAFPFYYFRPIDPHGPGRYPRCIHFQPCGHAGDYNYFADDWIAMPISESRRSPAREAESPADRVRDGESTAATGNDMTWRRAA